MKRNKNKSINSRKKLKENAKAVSSDFDNKISFTINEEPIISNI